MTTPCTSAVLDFFGIAAGTYRKSFNKSTVSNILRRNGYSVRSRKSALRISKNNTVGKLRRALATFDGNPQNHYYVGVKGHAMVLNGAGMTVVDTAPRRRDRRAVCHVNIVSK